MRQARLRRQKRPATRSSGWLTVFSLAAGLGLMALSSSLRRAKAAVRFTRPRPQPPADSGPWGWLPFISLVTAAGLVVLATAFTAARFGEWWAAYAYWAGMVLIFLPVMVRLLQEPVARRERIGLVLVVGAALFLSRVLFSPVEFGYPDELQHYRDAVNTITTGRLFERNPILEVSAYYPALQSLTAALVQVGGGSIFVAGEVVIGLACLAGVLALYLLYEEAGAPPLVAGIAALVYMANPHYRLFSVMYAYESLALPIAFFVLLAVARSRNGRIYGPWAIILLLAGVALATAHHVTSYATTVMLFCWVIGAVIARRTNRSERVPDLQTALIGLLAVAWLWFVARATIDYLLSSAAFRETAAAAPAATTVKQTAEAAAPPVETALNMAAAGMMVILLPVGLIRIWQKQRGSGLALFMAIGSLGYLASLGVRFVAGSEVMGRMWPFVYLPAAYVAAMTLTARWPVLPRVWRLFQFTVLMLLFIGGITSGWPPYWGRLPGPYLPAGFERSVEPESVAAAVWTGEALGPNNRIASDSMNHHLTGAHGGQDPVDTLASVYLAAQLGDAERALLAYQEIRYILVDFRLSTALPAVGHYFGAGEHGSYSAPLPLAGLQKFDGMDNVSRVYDGGDIVLYDVGRVVDAP